MIRNSTLLSLAILLLPSLSQATQCEFRAVTLPLKNQRLGGQAYMRGVSLGVGTPEQNLSFTLCAAHANIYAYGGPRFCRDGKGQWCFVGHGGEYDPSLSTSSLASDPPVTPFVDDGVDSNWTTDSLTVDDDSSLRSFKLGVPADQLHRNRPQAEIGVAVNSTFINALRTMGNISSNIYSLFWGDEFANQPRDGSVVFGGYDESIMGESVVTKAFTQTDSRCPEGMMVDLTEMKLNNQNGTVIDLLAGFGILHVCVVPSLRAVMAIPRDYGRKLIDSMGGRRSDNETNVAGKLVSAGERVLPLTPLLEPDSATFKGQMSVTIQDTVTVNFTDDQLLIRKGDPYFDMQGVTQFNTSQVGLTVISMIEDPTQMPRLGGMFFSSAYLMVNHDKNEFSIASAPKQSTEATIISLDTANDCAAYSNGSAPGHTSQPSQPGAGNLDDSALSTGAIAGIAIGAVAGFALLAVSAFVLWRRRGKGKGTYSPDILHEVPAAEMYTDKKGRAEVHEAPGQGGVLKMSADERDYAIELDGTARPSELPDRT